MILECSPYECLMFKVCIKGLEYEFMRDTIMGATMTCKGSGGDGMNNGIMPRCYTANSSPIQSGDKAHTIRLYVYARVSK